ncbi:MAG: Hpt domain-containing protein [Desulfosudis oleivorans]|nr:Hpt domain-containing protein [Desulfosudis oleivorans]
MEKEEFIIEEQAQPEEEIDSEFLEDFIIETREHIENIEMNILVSEKGMENSVIIHRCLGHSDTIKGLAGFVDQTLIQKIAHQTENLLDNCRKGLIERDKTISDLILTSSDYIKQICDNIAIAKDREFINIINNHLYQIELANNPEKSDAKKIGGF